MSRIDSTQQSKSMEAVGIKPSATEAGKNGEMRITTSGEGVATKDTLTGGATMVKDAIKTGESNKDGSSRPTSPTGSNNNEIELLKRRAERFNIDISDAAKKLLREAKFAPEATSNKVDQSKVMASDDDENLKKRQERFGVSDPTPKKKPKAAVDNEELKKSKVAADNEDLKKSKVAVDNEELEKRKLRAARFQTMTQAGGG